MKVKHLLGVIIAISIIVFSVYIGADKGPTENGNPRFLYEITGIPDRGLKEPTYAVAGKNGNVFIADSGNHRIKVFNKKQRFLFEFGGPESTKPLLYPCGIGLTDRDRIIVADIGAGAVYEFTSRGEYVKTWLDAKAKAQPAMVSVARDGNVFVTDLAGKQVLVFSDMGKLLKKISSREVALGAPLGLAVNKQGAVWVADGGNYNVKLLNQDGKLEAIFDGGPKWALTMAKGLALDNKGRIYVADTLSNIIRVFDQKGNDLFSFGPVDGKESMFRLPVGLSVSDDSKIYVADQGNNKVQVWGWK